MQWPGMVGAARRRRPRLRLPSPPLPPSAWSPPCSPSAPSPCSARPAWRSSPATRCSAAAILAIFVAVALLGWRLLERRHPWRRRWQVFAGLVALMFVLWLPNQWDLDSTVSTRPLRPGRDRARPQRPRRHRRLRQAALRPDRRAQPPRHPPPRLQPRRQADRRSSAPARTACPGRGYFLNPASPFVIHNFILDPNDPTGFSLAVPPGFERVARNDSWVLYKRC